MSAPDRALLEEKIRRVLAGQYYNTNTDDFDSTVDELADLLQPSPAPERRPTRVEALRVGAEALGKAVRASRKFPVLPEEVEPWVDAVAALYGGYRAPEPVEVPTVHPEKGGRLAHRAGNGDVLLLPDVTLSAVAARSNAWEEIKGLLSLALDACSPGWSTHAHLQRAVALMTAPEMGVGPKKGGEK